MHTFLSSNQTPHYFFLICLQCVIDIFRLSFMTVNFKHICFMITDSHSNHILINKFQNASFLVCQSSVLENLFKPPVLLLSQCWRLSGVLLYLLKVCTSHSIALHIILMVWIDLLPQCSTVTLRIH